MPTFDGQNLTITLDAPTSSVLNQNVEADLYSEWKSWARTSDNLKFPPAFDNSVGGDLLIPGLNSGAYFFLRNDLGWRIISSDEDQTVNYAGNLIAADPDTTLILPTPGRTVLHLGLQPVTQGLREVLTDLNLIRQVVAGRCVVSTDDLTVTVYDVDDVTILRQFSISADGRLRGVL